MPRISKGHAEILRREGRLIEGPQKPVPKRNKYGAVKVSDCPHCGFTHDSKVEAARCVMLHQQKAIQLEQWEASRAVLWVEVHPRVTVSRGVAYRADFAVIFADGHVRLEDVKGRKPGTAFNRLKKIFNNSGHPWAPLRVVYGKRRTDGWEWETEP